MYRSIISNIQLIQQSLPKGKWVQRFFFLVEMIFTLTTTFTQVYPVYEIPLTNEIGLVQDQIEDQQNYPSYQFNWNPLLIQPLIRLSPLRIKRR